MKRDQVLSVLRERHAEVERRFNVKHLALFGSMARDEAWEDSDVDELWNSRVPRLSMVISASRTILSNCSDSRRIL